MRKLMVALIGLWLCGCATNGDGEPQTVRQRFDPSAESGPPPSVRGNGASWTALVPAPGEVGGMWARAFVRVGDRFPVHEQGKPVLFEAVVSGGNDDSFSLELRADNRSQWVTVPRDKPVPVRIAGDTYELSYPSVYVAPDQKQTTDKAMLIVSRRP